MDANLVHRCRVRYFYRHVGWRRTSRRQQTTEIAIVVAEITVDYITA